jgi:hypothetical protein
MRGWGLNFFWCFFIFFPFLLGEMLFLSGIWDQACACARAGSKAGVLIIGGVLGLAAVAAVAATSKAPEEPEAPPAAPATPGAMDCIVGMRARLKVQTGSWVDGVRVGRANGWTEGGVGAWMHGQTDDGQNLQKRPRGCQFCKV